MHSYISEWMRGQNAQWPPRIRFQVTYRLYWRLWKRWMLMMMIVFVGYFKENILLHFIASMISGLLTTAASMPVDIAKTRFDCAPRLSVWLNRPSYLSRVTQHWIELNPPCPFNGCFLGELRSASFISVFRPCILEENLLGVSGTGFFMTPAGRPLICIPRGIGLPEHDFVGWITFMSTASLHW